ncbi:MAG: leucine-rich repeat domain-containing protein, partial [Candidatus Methanomethylophilaceae archaeon]|nr:leucine-rich repeat domain-containing protein [Candidatus Methanomethylophilaceae archaeon]
MKECYANFKGARALVVLALALAAALATVSIAEGTEALSEYDAFSVDGITYEVENVEMKHVYIDYYQGNPTHIFGTVSYDGSIWTVDSMISNAFLNCNSLVSVDLPGASNVTYSAFQGCSNLKEVNLPKAGYIGDYAFQGCNALTHIKFSESLLNVGDEAFSVSFYSEGKSLAADAGSLLGKEFVGSGDGDLHEGFAADSPDGGGKILYGVTDYASHSVGIVGFEGGPAQISGTVSHGGSDWTVVSVGDNALKGCTCMKFVDLPEAVSIGNGAFSGCPSLRNVRFSSSLAIVGTDAFQMEFRSEGDAIASDADHLRGKEFVDYGGLLHEGFIVASPDGEGDILLKIRAAKPKYVDIVGFEGNPSQVSGTVSYGGSSWTIMSVSNDAFYGCQSLETADLPNATELGINAFNGCTSLKEINIPHTTYISDDTFNGCTSLRYMDLQSVVDLNENAFYDCLALSHIRFSDKLDNVGMDVFSVDFYSEGELLAADAGSLRGRTFTGSGDGDLYESFAISWLDDAGALADTTFARKGETPSHDSLTKEPTDRYTYEFAGWSPEPVPASGEESYTAVFDAAVRT